LETLAVIQLATTGQMPAAGALSRAMAALLAGRLNRAPNLQASLVELRVNPHPDPTDDGEPTKALTDAHVHDKIVVGQRLETEELTEIARSFRARNWLTGHIDVDTEDNALRLDLEMAPVSDPATAVWSRSFEADLDDVAALLNAAALAVADELGKPADGEHLQRDLPIETRSFDAFYHYCRALDATDPRHAREALRAACGIDPYFVEALGELALWALRDNDHDEFDEIATLLLHAGHMRPRRLAEELERISEDGWVDQALRYALLAARIAPNQRELIQLIGELALRAGPDAAREATELFDAQAGGHPDAVQLLALHAGLHRSLGEHAQADTLVEHAIASAAGRSPEARAHCFYALGTMALSTQDLALAIGYLERAIAEQPALTRARGDLAAAYIQMSRFEDAARLLQGFASGHVVLQSNLALALRHLGRLPEAIEAAERAVNADPSHPQAWAILGDLLHTLGRLHEAREAFERAVNAQPRNVAWRAELGRVLFRLERFADALAQFRVVMAQQPELAHVTPELLFVLAETAHSSGRIPEAETLLQRAWHLDPTLWQAANNLGVMMLQTERFEDAVLWLSRANEHAPDNEGVRFNLRRALEQLPHRH